MTRRAFARLVALLAGLALVAYLVRESGPQRVASVLWSAGRWIPLVVALEIFQLVTDFFALRSILGSRWREIPTATWFRSTSVAYAMMILLPAGRAAGEVARAAIFSKPLGTPRAAKASTMLQAAYLTANGILSAVAFVVVATHVGATKPLALLLAANVVFQAVIAGGLIAILRDARIGRWLDRLRMRFVPGAVRHPPLDADERRRIPWQAAIVCTVGRASQVLQYGIILHAVGGVLTVSNAFIAHGIHLVGATLGDMLPNQLGVTDGAYLAFAGTLGFADDAARALSIAFLARIAQLMVTVMCVLVATLTRPAGSPGATSPASARADARS